MTLFGRFLLFAAFFSGLHAAMGGSSAFRFSTASSEEVSEPESPVAAPPSAVPFTSQHSASLPITGYVENKITFARSQWTSQARPSEFSFEKDYVHCTFVVAQGMDGTKAARSVVDRDEGFASYVSDPLSTGNSLDLSVGVAINTLRRKIADDITGSQDGVSFGATTFSGRAINISHAGKVRALVFKADGTLQHATSDNSSYRLDYHPAETPSYTFTPETPTYVLMASEGLWKVLNTETVINFLIQKISAAAAGTPQERVLQNALNELCAHAREHAVGENTPKSYSLTLLHILPPAPVAAAPRRGIFARIASLLGR